MSVNLPGRENKVYWKIIKWWAENHGSDGCSKVPDIYIESCWEHDFHFRYAKTIYGDPITMDEANTRFRKVIQMYSKLRWFSPMSWWRWIALKGFSKGIWDKHRANNLPMPDLPLNP